MVELLEGVHVELPVRLDRGAVEEPLALHVERVVLELVTIGPRKSIRFCSGSLDRLTKMNPAHTSQCTGTSP